MASSLTFTDGTTSQGITAPSMTPLDIASGIWGRGRPTGTAPSDFSILVVRRVGPRTFRPFKSATDLIGLSLVWITPGPWTCRAISWTSLNSSFALACTYSHIAREVASALVIMNGNSNTSVRGMRPGVFPTSVQTTSTTPSLA